MRKLSTLFSIAFNRRDMPSSHPPPQGAAVVHDRINRVLRRRLSDRVAEVFHEACLGGDLETATELLVVMEAMHVRRQVLIGDRRANDDDLVSARSELAKRKVERETYMAAEAEAER